MNVQHNAATRPSPEADTGAPESGAQPASPSTPQGVADNWTDNWTAFQSTEKAIAAVRASADAFYAFVRKEFVEPMVAAPPCVENVVIFTSARDHYVRLLESIDDARGVIARPTLRRALDAMSDQRSAAVPPCAEAASTNRAADNHLAAARDHLNDAQEKLTHLVGVCTFLAQNQSNHDVVFNTKKSAACGRYAELAEEIAGSLQCIGYELDDAESGEGATLPDPLRAGLRREEFDGVHDWLQEMFVAARRLASMAHTAELKKAQKCERVINERYADLTAWLVAERDDGDADDGQDDNLDESDDDAADVAAEE